MRALFESTEAQKILDGIIKDFPSDSPYWNEAQNRFQFVDRLLTECLGWDRLNIEVENSDELGGRSDYLLGRPPKAVLEAKRESKLFNVPPTGNPAIIVRKIQPLLSASKTLNDAVRQVLSYCAIKGSQIAIICNGPQTVIFQAIIPGYSPLEGECYFFDGFNSYMNNFQLLWQLLSPEGITENIAYKLLSLHRHPRMPQKASTSIIEPYAYRYRNNFQDNLRSLSYLLLEEIEDNPTMKASFYNECYVSTKANNRHLLLSKKAIATRYKRVSNDSIVPSALEEIIAIDNKGIKLKDTTHVGIIGSRPFIVIGDVGVGKTSFFENLFHSLDSTEKSNTYFIHINLGINANLSTDIKSYILEEIPDVLKNKYGIDIYSDEFANSVYYRDLLSFDDSVKGKLKNCDETAYKRERIMFLATKTDRRDRHLQASLGHLVRGQNKQIILVLDNADQRTFQVQQETFLIAQELAASRNLIVFVALRPSTFYLSKTTGALSAYQNKILTISPPPADIVVQKRLIFACRVAEGKVSPSALSDIRLNIRSVVLFLNATLRSIHDNESIRQFLSNITGGNTRAVIELITGFFGSPNVDSKKIVHIEEQTKNYKIPLHEFTKHALLGEYAYFNSLSSLVACNIFDVSTADPREHFLASLLIAYLSSGFGVLDNDGFVSGQELMKEMARHGFVEDQIRHTLRRLATKRLIETPHAHYRELTVADNQLPEDFHFRATSVGIYHVNFWTGSFAFLDAVSTDTPIFDQESQETISKFASSFEIDDRYKKTCCFRKYLENQWHLSNIVSIYYNFVSLIQSQDNGFVSVKKFLESRKTHVNSNI